MSSGPFKQGQRDFERGVSEPPATYFSKDYRDEWRRGWNDAESRHAVVHAEQQRLARRTPHEIIDEAKSVEDLKDLLRRVVDRLGLVD